MLGVYSYDGIQRNVWIYNRLHAVDDWPADINPSHVRITVSGSDIGYVEIYNKDSNLISADKIPLYIGQNTIELNFKDNSPLQDLIFNPINNSAKIVNIELCEDGEWTSYFDDELWRNIQENYMVWEK